MRDQQMSDDDEEVKRVNTSGSKDNSASFNNDLYSDEDLAMVGNIFTGKSPSTNCLFRPTKEVHSRLGHQECVQSKLNKRGWSRKQKPDQKSLASADQESVNYGRP